MFESWRRPATFWNYGVNKLLKEFLMQFELLEQKEGEVSLDKVLS